jgi:hypothetical protein
VIINTATIYAICDPSKKGFQCGLVAVRPQAKSPIEIEIGDEIKHISLPINLNNQPIATFAKNIFLPYV